MKSPIKDLRYASRALSVLKRIIPADSSVESFLLFAGDLEINLAEAGRQVTAHTNRYVIYDFWVSLFESPWVLSEMAQFFYPFESQEVFNVFQKDYSKKKDPYMRAALFFLLNRCSSIGMISSGDLDQKNYTPMALTHLERFKQINFDVVCDQSENFLANVSQIKDTDFIFFPVGKFSFNLLEEGITRGQEETTIYHKELKETVDALKTPTILNYVYHPGVVQLYSDYEMIMLDKYGKDTSDKTKAKELIIANFGIS
jgi:site-specific DNA-adenine methylase